MEHASGSKLRYSFNCREWRAASPPACLSTRFVVLPKVSDKRQTSVVVSDTPFSIPVSPISTVGSNTVLEPTFFGMLQAYNPAAEAGIRLRL